jgi:hypothetical protein
MKLFKGEGYPGWTFKDGQQPQSRSLNVDVNFSGCDELANTKSLKE